MSSKSSQCNPTDEGLITGNPNTWTEPPTLKSIYDPCPYGYRVPPSSSFSEFPTSYDPWTNGDITGGVVLNNAWWAAGGGRWIDSCRPYDAGSSLILSTATPFVTTCAYLDYHASGAVTRSGAGRPYALTVRCLPE